MKLGRLPKPNAPLGGGGSFRWPTANDGRKMPPTPIPPLPKTGIGDVGDEDITELVLAVKAIDGNLGNELSEILLLVVKPWSGNPFCCRPCW